MKIYSSNCQTLMFKNATSNYNLTQTDFKAIILVNFLCCNNNAHHFERIYLNIKMWILNMYKLSLITASE